MKKISKVRDNHYDIKPKLGEYYLNIINYEPVYLIFISEANEKHFTSRITYLNSERDGDEDEFSSRDDMFNSVFFKLSCESMYRLTKEEAAMLKITGADKFCAMHGLIK